MDRAEIIRGGKGRFGFFGNLWGKKPAKKEAATTETSPENPVGSEEARNIPQQKGSNPAKNVPGTKEKKIKYKKNLKPEDLKTIKHELLHELTVLKDDDKYKFNKNNAYKQFELVVNMLDSQSPPNYELVKLGINIMDEKKYEKKTELLHNYIVKHYYIENVLLGVNDKYHNKLLELYKKDKRYEKTIKDAFYKVIKNEKSFKDREQDMLEKLHKIIENPPKPRSSIVQWILIIVGIILSIILTLTGVYILGVLVAYIIASKYYTSTEMIHKYATYSWYYVFVSSPPSE